MLGMKGQVSGVSLNIINADGQTLCENAFGNFTVNTVTTIASTSKMPSVVAIIQRRRIIWSHHLD